MVCFLHAFGLTHPDNMITYSPSILIGHIQYKHRTKGLHMPYFLVDYVRSRQMETKQVHEEVILKASYLIRAL